MIVRSSRQKNEAEKAEIPGASLALVTRTLCAYIRSNHISCFKPITTHSFKLHIEYDSHLPHQGSYYVCGALFLF
jgi:hypothetical protein